MDSPDQTLTSFARDGTQQDGCKRGGGGGRRSVTCTLLQRGGSNLTVGDGGAGDQI